MSRKELTPLSRNELIEMGMDVEWFERSLGEVVSAIQEKEKYVEATDLVRIEEPGGLRVVLTIGNLVVSLMR